MYFVLHYKQGKGSKYKTGDGDKIKKFSFFLRFSTCIYMYFMLHYKQGKEIKF